MIRAGTAAGLIQDRRGTHAALTRAPDPRTLAADPTRRSRRSQPREVTPQLTTSTSVSDGDAVRGKHSNERISSESSNQQANRRRHRSAPGHRRPRRDGPGEPTVSTGGAQIKVDKRTNNPPARRADPVGRPPGRQRGRVRARNSSRLYDVPSSRSRCATDRTPVLCTGAIVAVGNGVTTESNPQAGADYAFDSDMAGALDDLREGHGMERSRRLPGRERDQLRHQGPVRRHESPVDVHARRLAPRRHHQPVVDRLQPEARQAGRTPGSGARPGVACALALRCRRPWVLQPASVGFHRRVPGDRRRLPRDHQGRRAPRKPGLDGFERHFRTSEQVALGRCFRSACRVVFVYAVVAVLGWWRPVFVDDRPVQRWVWVVPIVFALAIVLGIDYADLADKGLGFVLLLLLGALCVGFAEEGMFRGIGVTALRDHGLSEAGSRCGRASSSAPCISPTRSAPAAPRRAGDRRQLRRLLLLLDAARLGRPGRARRPARHVRLLDPVGPVVDDGLRGRRRGDPRLPLVAIILLVRRHRIEPP